MILDGKCSELVIGAGDGQNAMAVIPKGAIFAAENLDKTVTVTVTGLGTITFNGNAFAKAMAKSGNTQQSDLGAALYNYGAAAKTCFGA